MVNCYSHGVSESDKLPIHLQVSSMLKLFFVLFEIIIKWAMPLESLLCKSSDSSLESDWYAWLETNYLEFTVSTWNFWIIGNFAFLQKSFWSILPNIWHSTRIAINVQHQNILISAFKVSITFSYLYLLSPGRLRASALEYGAIT